MTLQCKNKRSRTLHAYAGHIFWTPFNKRVNNYYEPCTKDVFIAQIISSSWTFLWFHLEPKGTFAGWGINKNVNSKFKWHSDMWKKISYSLVRSCCKCLEILFKIFDSTQNSDSFNKSCDRVKWSHQQIQISASWVNSKKN